MKQGSVIPVAGERVRAGGGEEHRDPNAKERERSFCPRLWHSG